MNLNRTLSFHRTANLSEARKNGPSVHAEERPLPRAGADVNRLDYPFSMLQVGDTAPDFKLPIQSGEKLTLSTLLKEHRAVVLAFYLLDFSGQ